MRVAADGEGGTDESAGLDERGLYALYAADVGVGTIVEDFRLLFPRGVPDQGRISEFHPKACERDCCMDVDL